MLSHKAVDLSHPVSCRRSSALSVVDVCTLNLLWIWFRALYMTSSGTKKKTSPMFPKTKRDGIEAE
ncbi:hypothetical protein BDV36DRAFT_234387 [Aspergillus pseudocaelatus]|uniref:Uncharacterized protein n=1 Tax=Aspergillus pseudocaelatus TaxID=1825620 RepID=A0ABQ6WFD2_9EURO|nr:hypothetical protein BDV36DRAFT_234387 [Aspergillus pseudocaelatus]